MKEKLELIFETIKSIEDEVVSNVLMESFDLGLKTLEEMILASKLDSQKINFDAVDDKVVDFIKSKPEDAAVIRKPIILKKV